MKKNRLLYLIVFMLFPVMCFAQNDTVVDVDDYIEELNAQCPIEYKDDWGLNSLTMVGERYALVDVMIPSSLSMFLSTLTGEGENVKRMWIKQLKQYGEQWNRLVDLLVAKDRRLVVLLRPEDCDDEEIAFLTFFPSDFTQQ